MMNTRKTVIFAVGFLCAVACSYAFADQDEAVDQSTMDQWLGWAGNVKDMTGSEKKLNPDLARDPRFENEEVDIFGVKAEAEERGELETDTGDKQVPVPAGDYFAGAGGLLANTTEGE